MRVNFTTYDVRRAEDVVKPSGPRCNVMGLNPTFSSASNQKRHPFWYAKVLGIFHANVMYHDGRNRDHVSRRIEFVWVRWYEIHKVGSWAPQRLDEVYFPSIFEEDSFGFVDPADILRSCHIVPIFKDGQHSSGKNPGHSEYAQDKHDWNFYYINR
jgi:hypothetical protein